jgi:RNA ligase (TIGR02306 family)
MRLSVSEDSLNYPCSVVTIGQVFDIKNADNIKRVVLYGNNVIVSKDVKQGDTMLYFVAGTQLSEDLCFNNNLYDEVQLNKDVTDKKGYISAKRRLVKTLKLKETLSDGMLLPIEALNYLEEGKLDAKGFLKIGDTFTHIGDTMICQKYVPPVKQSGLPKGEKQPKENRLKDLLLDNQFRFHSDTAHFARNLDKFGAGTQIVVTRKYHGSSLILSHVLVKKELNWFEKLIDKYITPLPKTQWGYIHSSGKPKSRLPKGVEAEQVGWTSHTPSFYSANIWKRAMEMHKHNLEKGITIYGEIVGQGVQGEGFTYGFEYEIFVYRITYTNPDGQVYEFSWEAVKRYCDKYGIKYVEEYFSGKVHEIVGKQGTTEDLLERLKDAYLDKSYPDCKVDEGICIRVAETDEIFKLKSPKFIDGESKELEQGISDGE